MEVNLCFFKLKFHLRFTNIESFFRNVFPIQIYGLVVSGNEIGVLLEYFSSETLYDIIQDESINSAALLSFSEQCATCVSLCINAGFIFHEVSPFLFLVSETFKFQLENLHSLLENWIFSIEILWGT